MAVEMLNTAFDKRVLADVLIASNAFGEVDAIPTFPEGATVSALLLTLTVPSPRTKRRDDVAELIFKALAKPVALETLIARAAEGDVEAIPILPSPLTKKMLEVAELMLIAEASPVVAGTVIARSAEGEVEAMPTLP